MELFGPAVALTPVSGIDEAIALANDSDYGLGAGLFTSDLESALRFATEVDCGSVQINSSPLWRSDPMPYGGSQAKRDRQGGAAVGDRGDDGAEDGGVPPWLSPMSDPATPPPCSFLTAGAPRE